MTLTTKTNPVVSVVICTYNQQHFIKETIDSVLAQTYPHIEIIVADDCSTDGSTDILRQYAADHPQKIKLVLSEVNTGIPSNFNRGLAVRTGEYMATLDGDDLMMPTKIEKQVTLLRTVPEAGGCFHDAEVFLSDTGQSLGLFSLLYNGTTKLREGRLNQWFLPRNFFLQSSLMFRSALCPPWGYDERLPLFSEALFCIETLRNSELIAIPEALVRYRRHAKNLTDSIDMRQRSIEHELVAYAILDARYPNIHSLTKRTRLSAIMTNAIKQYRDGNHAAFRERTSTLIKQGAPAQGLILRLGAPLFGRQIISVTGTPTYQRPGLFKRLSQWFLRI